MRIYTIADMDPRIIELILCLRNDWEDRAEELRGELLKDGVVVEQDADGCYRPRYLRPH